jgi:hypothetical protein
MGSSLVDTHGLAAGAALARGAARADTGGGRTHASPQPGESTAPGRTIVYRPLPAGGYEAPTMQPPGTRDNSMGRSTPP